MRTVPTLVFGAALAAAVLAGAACESAGSSASDDAAVVVTTGILGDVVRHLVSDDAEVEVLMPAGVDPHDFAPSARQVSSLREAALVVENGGGFEEGLIDAVEAAGDDGVPVLTAVDELGDDADPHFFTDPRQVAEVVTALEAALVDHLDGLDAEAVRTRSEAYQRQLAELDEEIAASVAGIAAPRRLLVTNHDVFGPFAARYGFEVAGAVIAGGSTLAEPSGGDLDELAALVEDRQIPAVFVETSSSSRLAAAVAAEVGHRVDVVDLYSESLGEPGSGADTYLGLMRTNTSRIVDALS